MQTLKEGTVYTYSVLQNTIHYQLRLTTCAKGLWVCIEESTSVWKTTITPQLLDTTVNKASAGKETLSFKEFISSLVEAVSSHSERWTVGIMTPIQLEVLRGGVATKQQNNTKIYLILSNKASKLHYPFTLQMHDISEKEKLIDAIKNMKSQLEELRTERTDKSVSSFSILSETYVTAEQLKTENEQLKKQIRIYEESLTQKRGAVEIDMILKEKNVLQIKAETKRRQQNRQIIRLRNIHQTMQREITEIRAEVDHINRQLLLLEDNVGTSAKLKSHALRVLKSYENELRTLKKMQAKQSKEIETLKRNIGTSKNNERKVQTKIKQIQSEIEQAKKKTNIKEISNRLHSKGQGSSAGTSSKAPSVTSSIGKQPSQTSAKSAGNVNTNIVRENLLKKTQNANAVFPRNNQLLRTSPNIKLNHTSSDSPDQPRKSNQYTRPAPRPINSSHQIPKYVSRPNDAFKKPMAKVGSDNQSIRSASIDARKKEMIIEEKERQKRAIERLNGKNVRNASNQLRSREKIPEKVQVLQRREIGRSLQSKQPIPKRDTSKDILTKMKEVKAHYGSQANKNIHATKALAAKVAELSK